MSPKILLFGGAFDPLHNGHLAILSQTKKHQSFHKIIIIPSYTPPLKNQSLASANDRLNMLKLFCQRHPNHELLDFEIQKKGISYSIDTINHVQNMYPNHELYFLIGSDNFFMFHQWHNYSKILQKTKLIIINRTKIKKEIYFQAKRESRKFLNLHDRVSAEKKGLNTLYLNYHQKYLSTFPLSQFIFLDIQPIPISSTDIRQKVAHHQNISSLVPPYIAQYILNHQLYQTTSSPLILGVTGQAGSGKSTAAQILQSAYPFTIIDLDQIGHHILTNPKIKAKLIHQFGPQILDKEQNIDRTKLGSLVFNNPHNLKFLNKLVHPQIKKQTLNILYRSKKHPYLIVGALLQKIGLKKYCHYILNIEAPDQKIKNISPQKYQITKLQKNKKAYQQQANHTLQNSFNSSFETACLKQLSSILKKPLPSKLFSLPNLSATLVSAVLAALIFQYPYFYPALYIFFIPILFRLEKNPPKNNFFLGLIFGFIFMSIFHSWLLALKGFAPLPILCLAWILLSLYLSFFYAGIFAFYSYISQKIQTISKSKKSFFFNQAKLTASYLLLPFIWSIGELCKTFGILGSPGGVLGYAQTIHPLALQPAVLFSVFGLSFMIMLINFCLYKLLKNIFSSPMISKKAVFTLISVLIFIIIATYSFGHYRLSHKTLPFITSRWSPPPTQIYSATSKIDISLIQGNHTQKYKMNSRNWNQIRQDYLHLTQKVAPFSTLIIWPETFLPSLNLENKPFIKKLQKISNQYNSYILFGTPIYQNQKYYNAAAIMTPHGLAKTIYQKQRLMPFGEYLPLKSFFDFLHLRLLSSSEFSTPKKRTLLTINQLKLGLGICLESVYPQYFKYDTQQGAQLLIVLANNAWFGSSSAARKHLQISILRAVENNKPLIQIANTGLSAIIDAQGKILNNPVLNQRKIIYATFFY